MKTKILAVLSLLLLASTALQAQFAYMAADGAITITAYIGFGGAVTIPATINTLPVTSIEEGAFFDQVRVTSVSIPSSVTSIGSEAFEECPVLTNITVDPANPAYSSAAGVLFDKNQYTLIQYPGGLSGSYSIPNSVTDIVMYAFAYATNLTAVTIPDGVRDIESDAFYGASLTNVAIPATVTNIEPEVFVCLPLTNISVDAANPAYSSVAGVLFDKDQETLISYPQSKPGGYTVPGTVTTINGFAFEFSSGLTSITNPASVISIGTLPFLDCTNLTNITVNTGNPVYSSSSGVLFNTNQTTLLQYPPGRSGSYAISNGVTTIGSTGTGGTPIGEAFYDCSKLTGITIPDTVKTIQSLAFHSCVSLTNVTIPASVTGIGIEAFESCTSLTNFTVAAGNTVFTNESGVLFNLPPTVLFIYPPGKAGNYTIPDTVNAIDSAAFVDCINLTGVVIPNSVTNIGQEAFYFCTNLAAVTIPGSVTQIGAEAFMACHQLTSLTISNGITSIPGSAFQGCISLTSVTLPNSITNIADEAFFDCTNLATVFLGNNVAGIGPDAFDYCTALRGIYFPGNAPGNDTNAYSVFSADTNATAYYLPGTTGWGPTFEGIPTAPWLPQMDDTGTRYGAQTNQFGFNINWGGNETVVVEACSNLVNSVWLPVGTNTLANGDASFNDPQWTHYPTRLYRIRYP